MQTAFPGTSVFKHLKVRQRARLVAVQALLWACCAQPLASQERVADVALILAVDCSFSVDHKEFDLQMRGLAAAFQNPGVWRAISEGPNRNIAVLVMEWSDGDNQKVMLPWTIIASQNDADRVGRRMLDMPRVAAEGGTAIARAITFASLQFATSPASPRHVIDVSFDGRNNVHPALPATRDLVVGKGIVINALPITNEVPTLDIYATNQLIGGAGAFVMKANTYDSYGAAIFHKLIREIVGPGIS